MVAAAAAAAAVAENDTDGKRQSHTAVIPTLIRFSVCAQDLLNSPPVYSSIVNV